MVDTLHGLKAGNIIAAEGELFKIAKMGAVTKKVDGGCTYEVTHVRTCPPTFRGGALTTGDYGSKRLSVLLKGNHEAYWRQLKAAQRHGEHFVDLTLALVGEGDWMPTYDVGDFTKLDLIAYVIAVHGPSIREDIMRRVAALESLPWVPTSNNEYFSNVKASGDKGRFYGKATDDTMAHAGKLGRKQLYGLGETGKARAKAVLARLGEGPARQVDGEPEEPSKAVPPIRRVK